MRQTSNFSANRARQAMEVSRSRLRLFRAVLLLCVALLIAGTGLWYGSMALGGSRGTWEASRKWDLRAIESIKLPGPPPRTSFAPGEVIGRIIVPAMGVDLPIVQMVNADDDENLKKGPGHILQTALGGQPGNCVIAGHRTTFTRPFYRLGDLRAGDEVLLVDLSGNRYRYLVNQVLVVPPTAVQMMDPTPEATVTLIACHPLHSASSRLIVKGVLQK